jgi:hypothetical protein
MNMIEKVARAIATADEQNGGPPYEVVVQNKHSRNYLYDQAKAAIEAMATPTNAMVKIGGEYQPIALPSMRSAWSSHTLRAKYAAMMSEALNEKAG